jgi:hypothetical protein
MLVKEPEDYPTAMRLQSRAATAKMVQTPALEPELVIPTLPKIPEGPHLGHRIARAVAKAHRISFPELISQRRQRNIVYARWHAMFEIARRTKISLLRVGAILGGLDHTTVLYGIERHRQRLGLPPRTRCVSRRPVGPAGLLQVVKKALAENEKLWGAPSAKS